MESAVQMFPPQMLSQILCEIYSSSKGGWNQPFVWSEGFAAVRGRSHLIVVLHGASVKNYFENAQYKAQRKYNKFELLRRLDVLLSGPEIEELKRNLEEIEGCMEKVRDKFWKDLQIASYELNLSGLFFFF